ncbi:MAG: invasion associated locus B family protein [Pseudomonadota bacterium]
MTHFLRLAFLLLAALGSMSAVAQTQNRVDVKRDWSIFQVEREGAQICWIVSRPTKSVALRGGKQVAVNRGDIFLMVAIRPSDSVAQEVSFISGYPFKKGTEVEARIGSTKMAMFTSGENAWLRGPDEDAKAVSAFRKGVDAVVEGLSARGTTTIDTFSLLGFTAALESAQTRCK